MGLLQCASTFENRGTPDVKQAAFRRLGEFVSLSGGELQALEDSVEIAARDQAQERDRPPG